MQSYCYVGRGPTMLKMWLGPHLLECVHDNVAGPQLPTPCPLTSSWLHLRCDGLEEGEYF